MIASDALAVTVWCKMHYGQCHLWDTQGHVFLANFKNVAIQFNTQLIQLNLNLKKIHLKV